MSASAPPALEPGARKAWALESTLPRVPSTWLKHASRTLALSLVASLYEACWSETSATHVHERFLPCAEIRGQLSGAPSRDRSEGSGPKTAARVVRWRSVPPAPIFSAEAGSEDPEPALWAPTSEQTSGGPSLRTSGARSQATHRSTTYGTSKS